MNVDVWWKEKAEDGSSSCQGLFAPPTFGAQVKYTTVIVGTSWFKTSVSAGSNEPSSRDNNASRERFCEPLIRYILYMSQATFRTNHFHKTCCISFTLLNYYNYFNLRWWPGVFLTVTSAYISKEIISSHVCGGRTRYLKLKHDLFRNLSKCFLCPNMTGAETKTLWQENN